MHDEDDFIPLGDHEPDDDETLSPGEPPAVDVRHVDGGRDLQADSANAADSPFDRIRAAYDRRLEQKTLIMEMPGWDGELLIEFGLLSPRDAKRLRSSTRGGDRSDMTKIVADLLGLAARGLSIYDPDGNPAPMLASSARVGLLDVGRFLPVGEVKSTRQGLLALFQEGPARQVNETSLAAFANEVGRWMADTSTVVTGAVDQTIDDKGVLVSETIDPGS